MSDDDRTLSLNDQQFAIMEGRHLADMFLRTTRGVTRAKALSLAEAFRLCDQQRADAMSETFALRAQLATVMAERDKLRGLLGEALGLAAHFADVAGHPDDDVAVAGRAELARIARDGGVE